MQLLSKRFEGNCVAEIVEIKYGVDNHKMVVIRSGTSLVEILSSLANALLIENELYE